MHGPQLTLSAHAYVKAVFRKQYLRSAESNRRARCALAEVKIYPAKE